VVISVVDIDDGCLDEPIILSAQSLFFKAFFQKHQGGVDLFFIHIYIPFWIRLRAPFLYIYHIILYAICKLFSIYIYKKFFAPFPIFLDGAVAPSDIYIISFCTQIATKIGYIYIKKSIQKLGKNRADISKNRGGFGGYKSGIGRFWGGILGGYRGGKGAVGR
jgi:hypothetical protein